MARSIDEIQSTMQTAIENADPTIESRSGPVFNIMLQPVSNEVAHIEAEQERIGALYSLQFQEVATTEETDALATNFGMQRAPGTKAKAVVFFQRYTKPTSPAVVTRGSLVGNLDGTLQYVTQEDAVIDPSNADAFFNAATRSYEVAVNVEAVSPGEQYNIPAFRINTLITANSDFNQIQNRSPVVGGAAEETKDDEIARIRKRFSGLNTGTIDGVRSSAADSFPEYVHDVAVVQPSSPLFERSPTTPALDLYIAGSNIETTKQLYVAVGGESVIPVAYTPAIASSLNLTINGISTTDSVIASDTGVNRGSTRAQDNVLLSTPLAAGDVVVFTYSYNRLVRDVQNIYEPTNVGDSLLFGTDILVKEAVVVPITVDLRVRVGSSFDVPKTASQVQGVIVDYIEQNTFRVTLFPEVLRESILNTIQGVTSVDIQTFKKTNSSLRDIEIIELAANEISTTDDATFNLSIK